MMSSDQEYRTRLDRLADELQHARQEQQRMSPGVAREERARELDQLEEQQNSVRSALGLPLCRDRVEAARAAAELAYDPNLLAGSHRAELERLRHAPEQKARRLLWWVAGGLAMLALAALIAIDLD